jgi:hypothetical protein
MRHLNATWACCLHPREQRPLHPHHLGDMRHAADIRCFPLTFSWAKHSTTSRSGPRANSSKAGLRRIVDVGIGRLIFKALLRPVGLIELRSRRRRGTCTQK